MWQERLLLFAKSHFGALGVDQDVRGKVAHLLSVMWLRFKHSSEGAAETDNEGGKRNEAEYCHEQRVRSHLARTRSAEVL